MKLEPQKPFKQFVCYKVFHRKMGRWQVCLYDPKTKVRKTILFSKYAMSCKLNRILGEHEEVDHIDGNKANDDLPNLEVVSREENKKRYQLSNPKRMIKHTCPICRTKFLRDKQRSYRALHLGRAITCSRTCGGKQSHL